MASVSKTLGSQELQVLQRALQLFTRVWKLADANGVKLSPGEQEELLNLTTRLHKIFYES